MARKQKRAEVALSVEQEELAQRIYQKLRTKMDEELLVEKKGGQDSFRFQARP